MDSPATLDLAPAQPELELEPVVHELRVVEGQDFDEDNSSMASFEQLGRRALHPHYPRTPIPHLPKTVLKVDGKVPDLLYVLKYIGWNDRVVECKLFCHMPNSLPE